MHHLPARALPIALCASLLACGGTQTPTTPTPPRFDPTIQPMGQLQAGSGGGLVVQKAAEAPKAEAHRLMAITWPGPWPEAMIAAPPVVAQVTVDGQGAAWLTSARAGSVLGAEVWGAVPKESRHPRPGAQRVQVTGGAVKGTGGAPVRAMKGDRVVFVALRDGPLSRRIVGTGVALADDTLKVTAGEVQGEVLAIRAGSVAEDIAAAPLKLLANVAQGACDGLTPATVASQLEQAVQGLPEVIVLEAGPGRPDEAALEITVTRCDGATPTTAEVAGLKEAAALETAFWSARALTLPLEGGSFAAVAPIAAARRGELATALWLQSQQTGQAAALLATALALQVGWWTDVGPLVRSTPTLAAALEARLFSAEAAYRLGDLDRAVELLRAPTSDTAPSGCLSAKCARVGVSATRAWAWAMVGRGQADAARARLSEALTTTRDPDDARALKMTLVQLQLMAGALDAQLLTEDPGAPRRHQAELLRYRAVAQLHKGGATPQTELLCQAAALYDEARAWADAVDMWIECAQAQGADSEAAPTAIERAYAAATRAMQPQPLAHAIIGRTLAYAERHAADRVPPGNAGTLLALSVQEARRAELFGQAGRVQRYGLLLLPATADINARAKVLRDGLSDALAGIDGIETAFLMSLMGQLEAMRQRYTEAEALLGAAVALAEAIGEPELAAGFAEELKAIQE